MFLLPSHQCLVKAALCHMFTRGFIEGVDTSSVQVLGMSLEIFDNKIISHFCASPFLYGLFHTHAGRSTLVVKSEFSSCV